MPRQRSSDSKKAETLYRKGMKLSEIAEKLKVPAGTVRRWKADQKWDDGNQKKRSETSTKTERKPSAKTERKPSARKSGGQPGNVNAVGNSGGGAPVGNKNAEKHGAYSAVYRDVFDDEERELAEQVFSDEEDLLQEQITVFAIRERRIIRAINKYAGMKDPVTGKDIPIIISATQRAEHKRVFDGTPEEQAEQEEEYKRIVQKKIDSGDRMPGRDVNILTTTENKDGIILRMERELTSVQSQKIKAINALAQLRLSKQKIDLCSAPWYWKTRCMSDICEIAKMYSTNIASRKNPSARLK